MISKLLRLSAIPSIVLGAAFAMGCGSSSSGSSGPEGTDGATTEGGSTSEGGEGGGAQGNLGAACTKDSDCGGSGLTCDLPTANDPVFGGGPPNGFCTKPCKMDPDCGAGGLCLTSLNGAAGDCVPSCTPGPALPSINAPITDTTKCGARPDVACVPLGGALAACAPTCGSDSQCPTGMHCDPSATVCVTTPNTGQANGTYCALNGTKDPCAGICADVGVTGPDGGAVGICSENCELGVDPATASTPASWTACGGPTHGLCAYVLAGNGAGDLGLCAAACSSQDQCANPDFFCYPVKNLTGTPGISNGWCLGAVPCPGGDRDCASTTGTTCVMTAYGPQCLSSQFPLGSAAPDGGTEAGASEAGASEAGASEAGASEAGVSEGGAPEAGTIDDGGDAGGE